MSDHAKCLIPETDALTRVLAVGLPSSSASMASGLRTHMVAKGTASWGLEPMQILMCGATAQTESNTS